MENNAAEQVAEIDWEFIDFFRYRLYESQSITIDWNRFLEAV